MDIAQFGEFKTGHLLPIRVSTGETDYAFVPQPLPPNWAFSERLWPIVAKAHGAIGTLNGVGQTLPNPRLLLAPLQQREALLSSRLEGTYATPEQLLLFEARGRPDPTTEEENAWLEVHNYYQALKVGHENLHKGSHLDRTLICQLHAVLLARVRGKDRQPGVFRKVQAYVGGPENRRRYVPPPPDELGHCLDSLEQYLLSDEGSVDGLVRAFLVHYQFEAIHPFNDGNGRVGRLLLSLVIQHWLGLSLPWLYMSEYFEKTRDEYKRRLFRISTEGEWDEWIEYCLVGAIKQATASTRRCTALNELKRKYRRELRDRGKRIPDIVDRLFALPVVRIVDLEGAFNVAYDTAKSDVECLMDVGVLQEVANIRPRTFIAPGVCDVAFGDSPHEG